MKGSVLEASKQHLVTPSNTVHHCFALAISGGLRAGVADGEEGGGAGGANGLVEDDVRDTELLERLSGW